MNKFKVGNLVETIIPGPRGNTTFRTGRIVAIKQYNIIISIDDNQRYYYRDEELKLIIPEINEAKLKKVLKID